METRDVMKKRQAALRLEYVKTQKGRGCLHELHQLRIEDDARYLNRVRPDKNINIPDSCYDCKEPF